MKRLTIILMLTAALFVARPRGASAASAESACASSDAGALGTFADVVAAASSTVDVTARVNGNVLALDERYWLDWTAGTVFPALPDDLACDQKLDVMAHVYWWTLKEGDLGADNPPSYSNCMDDGKQHAWNFVCPGMWQVGFGVQAWDHPMSEVMGDAERAYGTEEDALHAAYDASDLDAKGVSWAKFLATNQKNARLRRSWLERAPAVGFLLEDGDVVSGCIDNAKSWCRAPRGAHAWPEADRYGPTIAASRRSIRDTRALFAAKGLCE